MEIDFQVGWRSVNVVSHLFGSFFNVRISDGSEHVGYQKIYQQMVVYPLTLLLTMNSCAHGTFESEYLQPTPKVIEGLRLLSSQ